MNREQVKQLQKDSKWLAKGRKSLRHMSSGIQILSQELKKYYYQHRGTETHIRYNRVVDRNTEKIKFYYEEIISVNGEVIEIHPKFPIDLGYISPADWELYPLFLGNSGAKED
jgi:hypothetical protein